MLSTLCLPELWHYSLFSVLQEVYFYFHIYFVISMGFVVEDVNTVACHLELEEQSKIQVDFEIGKNE